MKKLPIGIQVFGDLIREDYLYVDKTKNIYDLVTGGVKYYFLSRPRRFGKSLLLSTLAELVSVNKDLFKGLWIHDRIQWTQHPVIHMDLSKLSFKTPDIFESALDTEVERIAANHNIQLDHNLFLKEKFNRLLEKMSEKERVVLLIDEYDKPIIEYMEAGRTETAKKIRDVLKSFFSIIKGSSSCLRFVFITGVSKFSKVSIFSDLNNLTDITLSPDFSTLLGYTEDQLRRYFSPYIEPMAQKRGVPGAQLETMIKKWYNGYSWDGTNFVYNPFSILNLFQTGSFENYWFTTGTPSFLVKAIRDQQGDITVRNIETLRVTHDTFDCHDIENIEIAALLFQTGYVTIKKVTTKNERKTFHLSYPNKEVRDSFFNYLFREYTRKKSALSNRILASMMESVENDDMDRLLTQFKSLFASIPYDMFIREREAYYHTVVYFILKLMGADVRPEEESNSGRLDAVLETPATIYIMEFKLGSAQDALRQIKEKKYYEKFQIKGKPIVLAGIGFDPEKRNIGNYHLELLLENPSIDG